MRTALLGLAALAPPLAGAQDAALLPARIEALAAEALERYEIPALAIAVRRGGTLVCELAAGEGRCDEGAYRIGSLTKVVTATLILRRVESGELRLSQTLGTLWPDAPEAWRAATLEELLAHASGLPELATPGASFWRHIAEERAPEEVLAEVAQRPLDFEAGSSWGYSNTGYLALGRVLERAAGEPYAAQVAALARELGLTGLHAAWDAEPLEPATSGVPPAAAMRQVDASAGLSGSAADVALLGEALLAGRALGPQTFALMSGAVRLDDGRTLPNGLGLFVGELAGERALSHSGAVHGFRSYLLLVPQRALVVCVLAATELAPVESIARRVALLALGLPIGPAGDGEPPADLARALTGRWRAGQVELDVLAQPSGLSARVMGGPGARLVWSGARRFEAELGAPSTLELAEDGRTLLLRQGARELAFTRPFRQDEGPDERPHEPKDETGDDPH